jgi:hypothetical protein
MTKGRPLWLRAPCLIAVVFVALVALAAVWGVRYQLKPRDRGRGITFGGYADASPVPYWGEDGLFGGGALGGSDWDGLGHDAGEGKSREEPAKVDGRPGTLTRSWGANGKLRHEQTYLGEKPHGHEIWWHSNGQKVREQHWREGELHGRSTWWYANSRPAEEAHHDHGLLHGTHRTWSRDGQELSRAEFRTGLREGDFQAWHANGARRCRANFRGDRLDGPWYEWDARGELLTQAEYRQGALVSREPNLRREPFTYPGPLGAADFAFVLSQGGGLFGFNTLRVSAAGRCEAYYFFSSGGTPRMRVWRKAVFQLTDGEQRLLRDAIRAADLFGLNGEHIDRDIQDGTQWVARLRAGGREARVYCSNKFPDRLRAMSRALRDGIMAPHRMELVTATRIQFGDGDDTRAWLED